MSKTKISSIPPLTYPILFLFLSSLLFWLSPLDIQVQNWFFDSQRGWYRAEAPFWEFLYKYGIFLGYFFALFALFAISYSYWNPRFFHWRRPAILMIFVLALGPGILVNLTLKEYWGRPRPREIIAFGGNEAYVPPGQMGEGKGKSFPCGHCSMGFYIAVPFLFLLRRRRKWAYFFLSFGIIYGTIIGWARMIAGGHFLSDVIWSGGIVWIVALIAYRILKMDQEVKAPLIDPKVQRKRARRATLIMGIFLPILTISLLLATPYLSKKEFYVSLEALNEQKPKVVFLDITEGDLKIQTQDCLQVNYDVSAFGFPNSKLRYRWEVKDTAHYYTEKLGWFTEVRNRFEIGLPYADFSPYFIQVQEGSVSLTIPEAVDCDVHIKVIEGDVELIFPPDRSFCLYYDGVFPSAYPSNWKQAPGKLYNDPNSPFKIYLEISKGSLSFLETTN